MKLTEIDEKKSQPVRRIRYRVSLSAKVGGNTVAWQTRVTANSPREAVDTAHQLFRKDRGEIQSTVMSKWELREVTPIGKVETV
jgi:hypothetical protein